VDILKVRYVFKLIYLDDRIISLRGGCLGPNKLAISYHNRRKKKINTPNTEIHDCSLS
jgi:hypothetical protein